MPPSITIDQIRQSLALTSFDVQSAWAPMRMQPNLPRNIPPDSSTVRKAGVLMLIYPVEGRLTTLVLRRTPDPGVHSGQISFPGGSCESDDQDTVATALREACEEIGLCEQHITVLGQLTRVYIPPSEFLVWPTVATVPFRPTFKPNPLEVAELLELPLDILLDDTTKCEKDMVLAGITFRVPFYDVQGHVVWGATALMLSEFEARLKTLMNDGR